MRAALQKRKAYQQALEAQKASEAKVKQDKQAKQKKQANAFDQIASVKQFAARMRTTKLRKRGGQTLDGLAAVYRRRLVDHLAKHFPPG